MPLTEEDIRSRMEELLKFNYEKKGSNEIISWATNILNTLKILLSPQSYQIETARNALTTFVTSTAMYDGQFRRDLFDTFHGILSAVLIDFNEGFLKDLRLEIRTEVESDFLAQARRLLDEGYKDPAAMLLGAVLEDTLRQLCRMHNVQEGRNISSMNEPLRQAGVYGLPTKDQVTAWAAIRNKTCSLTPLGQFYWHLVKAKRIQRQI